MRFLLAQIDEEPFLDVLFIGMGVVVTFAVAFRRNY
jgi:hypothetical protein